MQITYILEADDYLRYGRAMVRADPYLARRIILGMLGIPFIFFLYAMLVPSHFPWIVLIAIVAGIPLGFLSFVRGWIEKRAIAYRTQTALGGPGRRTMWLTADGIRVATEAFDTPVRWRKIEEIRDLPDMVILLIGPRVGHFVPKRAFATPDEAQIFVETARAYRQAAADGSAPVLPDRSNVWPPPPRNPDS